MELYLLSFTSLRPQCVRFKRPVDGHSHPERMLCLRVAAVADAAFFISPGGNTAASARKLNREDFELLCLDGTRKPVTQAESCYLAVAPNHAVVSRSDKAAHVEEVLLLQQVWVTRASCRGSC